MKGKIKIEIIIFSLIQLVLYALIFTVGGDAVRYGVVLCAFLFSLIFVSKDKNSCFTVGALGFTLIADLFLVLLDPARQLAGMVFFCGAQLCYAARVHFFFETKIARKFTLALRAAAVFAVQIVTLAVLGGAYDALSAVSMFYFTNLILNTVFAFISIKKQPVYALGMLAFVFCDIFVGFGAALGTYLSVSEGSIIYMLAHPPFDAMWIFYAPSQTLIAISSLVGKPLIKNIKRR